MRNRFQDLQEMATQERIKGLQLVNQELNQKVAAIQPEEDGVVGQHTYPARDSSVLAQVVIVCQGRSPSSLISALLQL